MAEYNNPAGRLLEYAALFVKGSGFATGRFDGAHTSYKISFISEFVAELDELKRWIDSLGEPLTSVFEKHYSTIAEGILSLRFDETGHNFESRLTKHHISLLELIAVSGPSDLEHDPNDLSEIDRIADDLFKKIETSEALSKSARIWLLDLVRVIQDSVRRFEIRGARGFKKQITFLLGELVENHGLVESIRDEDPGLWDSFLALADKANRVASLARNVGAAAALAAGGHSFTELLPFKKLKS